MYIVQDFTIESPLQSAERLIGLFLGPSISRSCFTITAINDSIAESPVNSYSFRIPFNVEEQRYQVASSASVTVNILDDDCKSTPHCLGNLGKLPCKDLVQV